MACTELRMSIGSFFTTAPRTFNVALGEATSPTVCKMCQKSKLKLSSSEQFYTKQRDSLPFKAFNGRNTYLALL